MYACLLVCHPNTRSTARSGQVVEAESSGWMSYKLSTASLRLPSSNKKERLSAPCNRLRMPSLISSWHQIHGFSKAEGYDRSLWHFSNFGMLHEHVRGDDSST